MSDNMPITHCRNVYFERSNGEFILLWENCTKEDVHLVIKRFLEQHNYKSYYTRIWERNGITWYDVGSHTEFFLWAHDKDVKELQNERARDCEASKEEE